jgi:hypothetical protein
VRTEYAISFLKDALPIIKIIPTTETEIKSTIHPFKSKNSTGYDEITSKILKSFSPLVTH